VSSPTPTVLEVRDLVCVRGAVALRAKGLTFGRGLFHLLQGDTDSGHQLFLRVLGLLEVPDAGEVFVEGQPVRELEDEARLKLRERRFGFIFTSPFLLPGLTVIENVAMPLFKISDVGPAEARERSELLLDFAAVPDLAQVPCGTLSLCEQHRVSLARALANNPAALLVESLDGILAGDDLEGFAALLREAGSRFGVGVIATTSPQFAAGPGDRVIEVNRGEAICRDDLLPKSEA
jgi:lipoprotein-releasing system ATP-binding protein